MPLTKTRYVIILYLYASIKYLIFNQTLASLYGDDDNIYEFERQLRLLNAVLMPFARAIQCLEARETSPVDVYIYWLAITSHLRDLFTRFSSKYPTGLQNRIRQIANHRFSGLIENELSYNVYLIAFALHPGNAVFIVDLP